MRILSIGILLLISCNATPKIPISNTLEISLDNKNKYSLYVNLLNSSIKNDTIALKQFLEIDYIGDAAGYDHGYILVELMKCIGDSNFAATLKKMNRYQLENVKSYFGVGIEGGGKSNDTLIKKYPLSLRIMNLTDREIEYRR